MTKISRVVFPVVIATALAACSTTPPPPPQQPAPAAPQAPAAPSVVPGSEQDLQTNVGDTVHFAYDKYNLDDSARATLQRQAAWLNRYPAVRVQLQGNCDERGTREYNLALGARRAEAAKEYLASLGVSPERMETISYGKERPVCAQSTEACWAQNRRDVTVVTTGPSS